MQFNGYKSFREESMFNRIMMVIAIFALIIWGLLTFFGSEKLDFYKGFFGSLGFGIFGIYAIKQYLVTEIDKTD